MLGAGVILGALLGAFLGRLLVGDTLALALGALVGALGAPSESRPGSAPVTVTADSTDQARQAREILARRGGDGYP